MPALQLFQPALQVCRQIMGRLSPAAAEGMLHCPCVGMQIEGTMTLCFSIDLHGVMSIQGQQGACQCEVSFQVDSMHVCILYSLQQNCTVWLVRSLETHVSDQRPACLHT